MSDSDAGELWYTDIMQRWIGHTLCIGLCVAVGGSRAARAHAAPVDTSPKSTSSPSGDRGKDLLWASNDPGLWAYRRELRMKLVPPPPDAPEVQDANGHVESGGSLGEIDRFIIASWQSAGLPEAAHWPALCDDATFCRRVYLDVIGVVPTLAEAERFLSDARPDKRARLVDELLARDQDYADHWTPFWEDAVGSTNVNNQGGIPGRGNYRAWIHQAFAENRPFDLFAAQLIDTTIPGAQKPMIAEANGRKTRTSYVLNETHTMTLQSAAAAAQVFMGTAMKCASCHNHFENEEWPQTRFLGFASMFAPKDLERIRCEKHTGEFIAAQFPFEIEDGPGDAGSDETSRLRRVAQLLTDPTNPRFAKAIVNRLWKRYLGLGLVEPADDFREDVSPTHPDLLEWLAYDFMSHDDNLKHTIRKILTSRTYQQAYAPSLEDHFDVAKKHDMRYFRSPTLRRLTAEQIVDSMHVATAQKLDPKQRLYLKNESTSLSRALGRPSSRNEISTGRADDVAVVQSLELLNGEEFAREIYACELATWRDEPAAQKADRLFRAVLTRPPTSQELAEAGEYLQVAASTARPAAPKSPDATLLDDDLPPDVQPEGEWKWVTRDQGPVAIGARSRKQTSTDKRTQHYVLGLPRTPVEPGDVLTAWVYLDPLDPPKEIMLQWNNGMWEHRAFWGTDEIPFGQAGTPSRSRRGDLPKPGEWVKLEVAAGDVGLSPGSGIVGFSFDQVGGTVYWDAVGVTRGEPVRRDEGAGDVLWALFVASEFQYTR